MSFGVLFAPMATVVSIPYAVLMEFWFLLRKKLEISKKLTFGYSGLLGLISGFMLSQFDTFPFQNYEKLHIMIVGCITGLVMPLLGREAQAEPVD